ncbi:lysoplasmalogenase [Primorskyibacter sp. S87]|uniref:lysoplasmalogenase n=1 Tax=Primorskyibacter sp. S87 TaxID=3415126 RepID=UPI003C7B910C
MPALILPATLCALLYLPLSPQRASLTRSLAKTLAVALLALAAYLGNAPTLLVLALTLCAIGDLLLAQEGDTTFMAGIGAFAAGHIAYIALFLSRPDSDLSRLVTSPVFLGTIAFLLLGVVTARILPPRAGELKGPVLAYIPIILCMGLAALTLPTSPPMALVLPSALAFILSDLILAAEKFLLPVGHSALRLTPFAIWPLYWGAQLGFLLAFS